VYQDPFLWYNKSIQTNKEVNMKGSIRLAVGFLLVFGSVGGMDNATDNQLVYLLPLAILGLVSMASGVKAMNQ
jgi:hypothetical protein